MTFTDAVLARLGNAVPGELILAADPDELLRGLPVQAALAEKGMCVLFAEDPVDFRLAYEALDDEKAAVVATRSTSRLRAIPADVRARSVHEVTLDVRGLLQPLAAEAVPGLSWDEAAKAYDLAQSLPTTKVTPESTISRLLRHLYGLDPEEMNRPSELLAGVLRFHRGSHRETLSSALLQQFASRVGDPLPGISTARALEDRRAFLEWLQTVWREVVDEPGHSWRGTVTDPPVSDVLDEYFKDGTLAPVDSEQEIPFGVVRSPERRQKQVDRLLEDILGRLGKGALGYQEWRALGRTFADATAKQMIIGDPPETYRQARADINGRFVPWVIESFSSLASLPAVPSPVSAHRAARSIQLGRNGTPAALVVMDGMSLAVWQLLAPKLAELDAHVVESAAYAWIPTLTSISRQAIFAGALPVHFADSLHTTAKEGDYWRQYWRTEANLDDSSVGYGKLRLADLKSEEAVRTALLSAGLGREMLGLAVEDIDLLIHSEVIDERALYARLEHWAERQLLLWLLRMLLDEGYRVYITADHGFVGVTPIGASKAGATADKHGRFERYADRVLADAVDVGTDAWRRWDGYGLPPDFHIVFAPMFAMYFTDRHTRLTHGGPTIEEVLIPWVEIYR